MRIFYVPDPPSTSYPEEARILSNIQTRRGEGATVNTARYEWDEHAPLLEGTGFREDVFRVLANKDFMGTEGEVLLALNPRQVAVFRYTDAMTKNIAVPEPIFEELRRL
ncbi:hypothetical protein TCE0_033r08784 [Talaromyces pinophilus]|uniref:Uncharacterized protein n=1 Tax=Talaromyces pinophilus TaxID=128442 RepID=A0A6V8HA15_TALPI|nr:hypothetical protein TCE0_033r08784 [Talaromyces pinophilus]